METKLKCVIHFQSSDSPEGHLPPDFFNHCPERHVSAQLLLLCAWRSSKEVSLLIGDLCTFETDQCSNVKLNLNYEEITNMSKFFSKILETIKHRGAFEQASFSDFFNLVRSFFFN